MQYQVGAILWHPRTGRKLYTIATVPDAVVHSWIPKKQMIGQVELFGAVLGLLAFREELANADVIHFVDNVIKGYSGKLDSARLVGMYWMLAALYRINLFIDRVESKTQRATQLTPRAGDVRVNLKRAASRSENHYCRSDPAVGLYRADPWSSAQAWVLCCAHTRPRVSGKEQHKSDIVDCPTQCNNTQCQRL
eukprot:585888-Amphidinium_carterae.1